MDFKDFSKLVKEYYGYKLSFYCLDYDTKTIECVLYESFALELSIGDRYGAFGVAIMLGNSKQSMTSVLGEEISLNSDAKSIQGNLELIDAYCRLRLPDKFLVEFDKLKYKKH